MPSVRRTTPVPRLEPVDCAPAQPDQPRGDRRLACKHALDRIAAATAILLLTPVMLVAVLAVKLASSGPVLIRERRLDRDGRSFQMLGFGPLPFPRALAIGQLPQLFNVVRGEMSFVGPRPERPEFVELFGENLRRHDQPRRVRPGITGWSQVRSLDGRAPLAERVRWDDFYAENWSLLLDLKILLRTLRDAGREPAES
jgi:lipopolysaccharide/colanic/teichoic acid biosynthesis glycosyltransferase